jgi:CheY-like chemotaxis protein
MNPVRLLVINMSKTILSINSNKSMNYLLQTVLSGKYDFVSVTDIYTGAKELKKNEQIDLILMDVDSQSNETLEFIHHINTSGLFQKTLIAVTSDKSEMMREKMKEVNVHDFIYKPFSPSDLMRTIEKTNNKYLTLLST